MGATTTMLTVERLQEGDEDKAQVVAGRLCGSFGGHDKLARFLSDDNNFLLVGYLDDKPVGYALAYRLERIDARSPMMYLHELDVATEYHRQGVGRALLNELKQICAEQHLSKLFVMTTRSNVPAVNLFESAGGVASSPDDVVYRFKHFD